MLLSRFEKALSSDRVFPKVFDTAGGKYNRVPSKDRAEVLRVCALLFTQRFVELNQSDLLVYCASRSAPLKVDNWLLKAKTHLLYELPEDAKRAKHTLSLLATRYPLLCIDEWSVDYNASATNHIGLSKAETHCLKVIDGWSLCLSDKIMPNDFGQSLNSMAAQMARDARADGSKKRGPGRTRKIDAVVDGLQKLYPDGAPNKEVKLIARELNRNGNNDFGLTTLRTALDQIK